MVKMVVSDHQHKPWQVGGRAEAAALGHGAEEGWSRNATEEVGPRTHMATESAQGPPRGRRRKEAWWEEGTVEAKSVAPGSDVERSGDGTRGRPSGVLARRSRAALWR
jgi:hypothetical protein